MQYFLAGYYVISKNPLGFGSLNGTVIHTCSTCINDSLLDHWSYSWTTDNNSYVNEIKEKYQMDDNGVNAIREWTDKALDDKKIGWINLFKDLPAAQEYVGNFFSHLPDVHIFSVYFSESEVEALIQAFPPPVENSAHIGLYENLIKKISETESGQEAFIGFDIIGVELDGSFHSFHCHDISVELSDRFVLSLNNYGLFKEHTDWRPIAEYMNDQENGFEPVPWFVCKIKIVERL